MAGLLDSTAQEPVQPQEMDAAPPAGAEQELTDPILQQIEKGIEAKVPPELKKAYMAVMVSGMKIMFDKSTAKFIEQRLEASPDIVEGVSKGIADLLGLIYNESKRTMSIPAAMLASISLMCQALDYAEKIGKVEITKELAAECTKATTTAAMGKFGITPDMVQKAINERQGGQQPQPPEGGGLLQAQQPMAGA